MKVYIILEHHDAMSGVPADLSDLIHGVFLDLRGAEDFVRGMMRYVARAMKTESYSWWPGRPRMRTILFIS